MTTRVHVLTSNALAATAARAVGDSTLTSEKSKRRRFTTTKLGETLGARMIVSALGLSWSVIEDFCFAVRVRPVHIDTLWLRAAAQKPAAVQAPRETTSRDGGGWGRFECPRTRCRQRCRGRCGDAGGDQWSPERCVGSLRIFTLIGGPAKFSRERTEQWRARPPKPAVLLHLRGGRRPRQGVPVYG